MVFNIGEGFYVRDKHYRNHSSTTSVSVVPILIEICVFHGSLSLDNIDDEII